MSTRTITFFDYHKPVLEDGEYTITVSQKVTANEFILPLIPIPVAASIDSQSVTFNVCGPRFDLDQSLEHSVYPPVGGKGDYMADLPSMVLNRNTLPWERSPINPEIISNSASWLFLLLIDEGEKDKVTEYNNAKLSDISDYFSSEASGHPPLSGDELQRLPKQLNYLEVDPSLSSLFPITLEELQYLSYTRVKNASGTVTLTQNSTTVNGTDTDFSSIKSGDIFKSADGKEYSIATVTSDSLVLATPYLGPSAQGTFFNTKSPDTAWDEKAVLLCNRLPQRGHNSTVYLISIENNYTGSDASATFSGIKNGNKKLIFPYFYKWQFHAFDDQLYCISQEIANKINQTFASSSPVISNTDFSSIYDKLFDNTEDLVDTLTKSPFSIAQSDTRALNIIKQLAKLPGSTFHGLLSHLAGGFGPFTLNAKASDITSTGTLKISYHQASKGNSEIVPFYTNAWYRSPLASTSISLQNIDSNFPFITNISTKSAPLQAAGLVINDSVNNIEDLTYAAAYELGRLTALDDVDFSTEFFKWKSETAAGLRLSVLKSISGYPDIMHLPLSDAPQIKPIPQHVLDKFTAWKNLKGIPYRYLVPDPELLPNESIRFFQLDANWINSFICGAFSIGHTVEADLSSYLSELFVQETITGFLINSLVVSGWPDFEVHVVPVDNTNISLLRKDNLDVNIRLYLFKGSFKQLYFHLHPGKMHSGFLYENKDFSKLGGAIILTDQISNGVINISGILNSDLFDKTKMPVPISEFAARMMEGVPTVVFTISD